MKNWIVITRICVLLRKIEKRHRLNTVIWVLGLMVIILSIRSINSKFHYREVLQSEAKLIHGLNSYIVYDSIRSRFAGKRLLEVLSTTNKTISFGEILQNPFVLALLISDDMCEPCIIEELLNLNSSLLKSNLVIFSNFEDSSKYLVLRRIYLKNNTNMNIDCKGLFSSSGITVPTYLKMRDGVIFDVIQVENMRNKVIDSWLNRNLKQIQKE